MTNGSLQRLSVRSVCPIFDPGYGIPDCCLQLVENLDQSLFDATVMLPGANAESRAQATRLRLAIPSLAFSGLCRINRVELANQALEWRYKRSLGQWSVAWLWPGMSIDLVRELKRRGHMIVLERINSPVSLAVKILDEATRRLDLPHNGGISRAVIEQEQAETELADYVFAPSPLVAEGFESLGVERGRIKRCSYGWNPRRFRFPERVAYQADEPIFVFVGSGIVRKGLPDLLDHWAASGAPGKLRIVGRIESSIQTRYSHVLSQPNVECVGFSNDLERVFSSADVFVLPSLEEGSPLVTYLALAAGLPCLVSLAGGGGIVTDDVEGLVREPTDADGFRDALLRLGTDQQLRERLGRAAQKTAQQYTWSRAAETRGRTFVEVAGHMLRR